MNSTERDLHTIAKTLVRISDDIHAMECMCKRIFESLPVVPEEKTYKLEENEGPL